MADPDDSSKATTDNDSSSKLAATATNTAVNSSAAQHVILFYKYHPLSPDKNTTEQYRQALHTLCASLDLRGRILVGASKTEGINGTLAGSYDNVRAFTQALLGKVGDDDCDQATLQVVERFWTQSKEFFDGIGESELRMDSPDDFKWSCSSQADPLFPDLNIKIVPELIGTGGALSSIPLEETAKGYLTPKEWHDEVAGLAGEASQDTILIDCRNTKEYTIGRFTGATDPQTTTFAQFPKWVDDHNQLLADKKVLMYCTGGIRCEKASAYIRQQVPSIKDVKHLKGGIHKYLEEYGSGDGGIWKGRNFVFDGRGAASADETRLGKDGNDNVAMNTEQPAESHDVVGKCISCDTPYDTFDPHCVCTVCREPTLTCRECQARLLEFHCQQHFHLRSCYFSNLERYSADELKRQLDGLTLYLEEISVGRKFRQKRKTLQKQSDKIKERLLEMGNGHSIPDPTAATTKCRNCGEAECSGRCWGFYGLKRKELLEQPKDASDDPHAKQSTNPVQTQERKLSMSKKPRRERFVEESEQLMLSQPPSTFRDPVTGIRVPPPCTRVLQTAVKAKWCGQSVLGVVQQEFVDLARPEVVRQVLENGLLRVNGEKLTISTASDRQLKMSDTISRVVHWHEPPVFVPQEIAVTKIALPPLVAEEFGAGTDTTDALVYVCNKPSSVPVHPAGPFLANSLTVMVEAQEKLQSRTLNPIHRTDRVTSGLTLCCTNQLVSRIFHRCLTEGQVEKLYLAKVHGKFPTSQDEFGALAPTSTSNLGERKWCTNDASVQVVAPVETVDPANGIRDVSPKGKPSKSLFMSIDYNADSDTSVVLCFPVTGRNHQLRVHLQWLGFSIVNDVQYGGRRQVLSTSALDQSADAGLNQLAASIGDSCTEQKLSLLSQADVLAAKRACQCCGGGRAGILQSFSPAQLLQQGHAIMLHALAYRVTIRPKKRKTKEDDAAAADPPAPLAVMEFRVDPPDWVDSSMVQRMQWFDRTI